MTLLSAASGYALVRHMGLRWAWFRTRHAFSLRAGLIEKRTPLVPWHTVADTPESPQALAFIRVTTTPESWPGFHAIDETPHQGAGAVQEAEAVLRGEYLLFGRHRVALGLPPRWRVHPFSGETFSDAHWARMSDFAHADIKAVWELGRFGWAFPLARAYACTKDERYAETYWKLFESWMDANPPHAGPHWRCGQEATFRLIAAAFARRVFANARATTPGRLQAWRRFVRATGRRIAANLPYALSQSNNHGVSECIGLLTAARILPGAAEAATWRQLGKTNVRLQIGALVYDDGAFAQHSTMYHRLLIQLLCWYVALERANDAVDTVVLDRARCAARFLAELTDEVTGLAPLCGSNDGTNVLPLADADYLDCRPVVQMAAAVLDGVTALPSGTWDEAARWLAVGWPMPPRAAVEPAALWTAPIGGWYLLRARQTRLFLRAPVQFRHRPAQADLLHVDVWWRGVAVTCDPGSYSYNSRGRFENGFADTRVHNTVEVDSISQMKRVSRFLFLPWPRGSVQVDADAMSIMATHDGYARRGVCHRRSVRLMGPQGWVVEDDLVDDSEGLHDYRLHWLFTDRRYVFEPAARRLILFVEDTEYVVNWEAEGGDGLATLVRSDERSDRGWWSPYYLAAVPALSLVVTVSAARWARFRTTLGPTV